MRFAILLTLSLFACNRSQDGNTASKYADFEEFYERFHRDSSYQMDHIIFPLQGLPREADSSTIAGGTFYWQKEDWVMHREINFERSDFERTLIPVGDNILIEQITHRNGEMGMMRRFVKMDGDWYLIYYAALNRIRKGNGLSIEGGF